MITLKEVASDPDSQDVRSQADGSPIDVLKQAIEELEKTIDAEQEQPQHAASPNHPADTPIPAADRDAEEGFSPPSEAERPQARRLELDPDLLSSSGILSLDDEIDAIELGSPDVAVEPRGTPSLPRERADKPDPFEQLGKAQDEPIARSPRVRNQPKPGRQPGRSLAKADDPAEIRRAKLSSLTSSSSTARKTKQPPEDSAPRVTPRPQKTTSESEEASSYSGVLTNASLTVKLIFVAICLILLAGTIKLSMNSRNRRDARAAALEAVTSTVIDRASLVEDAITGFWNPVDLAGKMKVVWEAERTAPHMQEYYRTHPLPQSENYRNFNVTSSRWHEIHSEMPEEFLLAKVEDEIGKRVDVILRPDQTAYKIDWEASVGYNANKLSTLLVEGSPSPVTLRVKLIPSDFYNFEFIDDKAYQSFAIEVQEDDEPVFFGFAERHSSIGHTLIRLFSNRDPRRLVAATLKLDFGKGGETLCAKIVAIEKLHWVL